MLETYITTHFRNNIKSEAGEASAQPKVMYLVGDYVSMGDLFRVCGKARQMKEPSACGWDDWGSCSCCETCVRR